MNKHKHTIHLQGFDMENGSIPFSMLSQIADNLTRVSSGALRVVMEGHSQRRGKQPEWLHKSIQFELSALKPGSTVLEIQAPQLKETITQVQLPLELGAVRMEDVLEQTAIDLAMLAYEQAFSETEDNSLLDKALLKDMQRFRQVFNTTGASFKITGSGKRHLRMSKKSFSQIKKLESQTMPDMQARITGTLDLMKHSNGLLEIVTQDKKVRAFLSPQLDFQSIKEFFGEEVTIDGTAHFTLKGDVRSFEVKKIRLAKASDAYFKRMPHPVAEQFQIADIAQHQTYKGTRLNQVVGKWPGDENVDVLLKLLD